MTGTKKSIAPDRFQTFRKDDFLKTGFIESTAGNLLCSFRNPEGTGTCGRIGKQDLSGFIKKGTVFDLISAGIFAFDGFKLKTACKNTGADLIKASRKIDRSQTAAGIETGFSDRSDAFRKKNFFQTGASCKSAGTDRSDTFRNPDRKQRFAAVKSLSADLFKRRRKFNCFKKWNR